MRRPPGWMLAAAAALALTAAGSLGGAPAVAAPVSESGYWWRLQPTAGSPAAPPGVEDGQLYVAADAIGTAATAAVRANVGTSKVEAVVLEEVSASEGATMRACPTSGWTAPEGAGAFGDRPSEERCDQGVAGVRAGGKWTFPVGDLVTDAGVLDVVFVPLADGTEVTFAKPNDATVQLVPPASAPATENNDDTGDSGNSSSPAAGALDLGAGRTSAPAPSGFSQAGDTLPAVELAAPPSGVTAGALERDVTAYPRPVADASNRVRVPRGRAPLALVAAVVVAAAWTHRTRAAVLAAPGHVLAQPLRHRRDILTSAGAALAEDPDRDLGVNP